ncbi:MAG TPA: hypothetical protein PKH07_19450, partial [bacterium]|nr:hypothetical protein [bacterium]
YRLLISSCADGVFFWWYPGGFRVGENSDYGIINADGTDREITRIIRNNAKPFLNGPSRKPTDLWIEFDRDAYPEGVTGAYDVVKDVFWEAIEDGRTPGLRTVGTGTTSANCPLLAVGNTKCTGTNPPKYLDGAFDLVEIQDANGKWVRVTKGSEIQVGKENPVTARVTITNLSEATWITEKTAKRTHVGTGAVSLIIDGHKSHKVPLSRDLPRHETLKIRKVSLTERPITKPVDIVLLFEAEGRTRFGERFAIKLVP